MKRRDMWRGACLTAYSAVSTSLALCNDRRLHEFVDAPIGSGIGGKSALLEAAGTPVFVKRVPLTKPERLPDNVRSTANVFGLPAFCQYGIGGRAVACWGGGPEVRRRIEALRQSSASVALFLEFIPQNLHEWLGVQMRADAEAADQACSLVESGLEAGTSFMNARGLLHFDAHFENILTDGKRLYFADYGLALSSRFELSRNEADFFDWHRTYDRCYTVTHLVHWLVTALYGYERDDRDALVRACAEGERPPGISGAAAAILARHAPLAAVMAAFYRKLQKESRETPYPLEEIRRVGGVYSSPLG